MKTIIHIGTHKTGTSALQGFLAQHRDDLRNNGLSYPGRKLSGEPMSTAHNFLALGLASGAVAAAGDAKVLFLSSEEFNRYVLAPNGTFAEQAQVDMQDAYFAGSDKYWHARRAYLSRLQEVFDGLDAELWITLRRPDNFCVSMYQQVVRMRRYTKTVSEFSKSDFPLFHYEKQLDQWSAFFPNIKVFVYEDDLEETGGSVGAYIKRLGNPIGATALRDAKFVNTASHPHMIDYLRLTNYFPLRKLAMRNNLTKWGATARDPMFEERWDMLSVAERDAVIQRFSAANARIKQKFNVQVSGRDTLFPSEIVARGPKYPGLTMAQFEKLAVAADAPEFQVNARPKRK
jgi:hypothetical protein